MNNILENFIAMIAAAAIWGAIALVIVGVVKVAKRKTATFEKNELVQRIIKRETQIMLVNIKNNTGSPSNQKEKTSYIHVLVDRSTACGITFKEEHYPDLKNTNEAKAMAEAIANGVKKNIYANLLRDSNGSAYSVSISYHEIESGWSAHVVYRAANENYIEEEKRKW